MNNVKETSSPDPGHFPDAALTPEEWDAAKPTGGSGSSYVQGVQEITLFGDPDKEDIYVQLLKCPAHSQVPAHHHAGDRVCTCLRGDWRFAFGEKFDASKLKSLPAGSIYTEPHRSPHFAQTGDTDCAVVITGYGPTDTQFVNPDEDPRRKSSRPTKS